MNQVQDYSCQLACKIFNMGVFREFLSASKASQPLASPISPISPYRLQRAEIFAVRRLDGNEIELRFLPVNSEHSASLCVTALRIRMATKWVSFYFFQNYNM